MSEQRVPLRTANFFKQMDDEDVCIFYHNLPGFFAQRMSWMKHPVLRQRQAMQSPAVSPLPPLTPIKLRSPFTASDGDDGLINPDDFA